MAKPAARTLDAALVEQGLVNPAQLAQAQALATRTGQPLTRILVQQGWVSEPAMIALIASHSGVTTIDLGNYMIKPDVIQLVPEELARRHTLIPVFRIGEHLTVAVDDPLNFLAVDDLREKTHCEIKTVLASAQSIRQAIDRYYTSNEQGTSSTPTALPASGASLGGDMPATDDTPVIRIVHNLVSKASQSRASDIHIEPGEKTLRTRFRIDGVLQDISGPSVDQQQAVVSRVKILANMDIAEKRKPQDGRFQIEVDNRMVDVRASIVPTQFGEKVVLRLLDRSHVIIGFEHLGMQPKMRETFEALIRSPHGIVLVTGPTGAGKTTSLYSALQVINSADKNILTIEDPIEYQLSGVNQVQVNIKADLTFSSALRSFLRQDPDVIMVGEIRDKETAEIAIQAALTGHLVLSTLHTNDAPSSLTRLIEMGIEAFLISSSVVGVLAQRLVRTICPSCSESFRPAAAVESELRLPQGAKLYRGKGCGSCRHTGYQGRLALFELLVMSEAVRNLLSLHAASSHIRQTARQQGMKTLWEDGVAKALAGATTIEEVLRVTRVEHAAETEV